MLRLYLSDNQLRVLAQTGHVTTCDPKMKLERQHPGISAKLVDNLGEKIALFGPDEKLRAHAWVEAAFETTFEDPHPYLVSGMGFKNDIRGFQQAYLGFWKETYPEDPLSGGTLLLVTVLRKV